MAARGHVQDPNDRRLRPIYGKDSMGSCSFTHVGIFGKGPRDLNRLLFKVENCWIRGQRCGPTIPNHGLCCLQFPMTVHLAAVCRSRWQRLCAPALNISASSPVLTALNSWFVIRLRSQIEGLSPSLTAG